jgi:hypothetical protein
MSDFPFEFNDNLAWRRIQRVTTEEDDMIEVSSLPAVAGASATKIYKLSQDNKTYYRSSDGTLWLPTNGDSLIDVPSASPNTEDDEFASGSLDGKWTNLDSATLVFSRSEVIITSISTNPTRILQSFSPGASAFTITAKFVGTILYEATNYAGISVRDSGNATLVSADIRYLSGAYVALEAYNGSTESTLPIRNLGSTWYVRISRDSGSTYTFSYSLNGLFFESPIASLANVGTVNKIGLNVGQDKTKSYLLIGCDWFRRT